MDIKDELLKFKNISEEILVSIGKDEIDKINPLLEKRQEIIDSINQNGYDSEVFRAVSNELKLPEIEKELNEKMTLKKAEIAKKIKAISNKSKVTNVYNKIKINSIIFSKKI